MVSLETSLSWLIVELMNNTHRVISRIGRLIKSYDFDD